MPPAATLSAEELHQLYLPNTRSELVRGELVVREPAGYRHGDVAMQLGIIIASFVKDHSLGKTFAAETGFTLRRDPDTVRAADVAFLSTARLPDSGTSGFAEVAPDLVVEVLSPDDRGGDVLAKVGDWLIAGTRLVWVINPVHNTAQVYRADGSVTLLGPRDALDGEGVLQGFSCALQSVLM